MTNRFVDDEAGRLVLALDGFYGVCFFSNQFFCLISFGLPCFFSGRQAESLTMNRTAAMRWWSTDGPEDEHGGAR